MAEINNQGIDGNFNQVNVAVAEHSWKTTSKPYGNIAHRNYMHMLMNMPRGPSEEEVLAQKQKEADNELWNKIMYEYDYDNDHS